MRKQMKWVISCILLAILLGIVLTAIFFLKKSSAPRKPDELLTEYMGYIERQEYGKMYQMIDPQMSGHISEEDFVTRNANIYEGIEVRNLQIEITGYSEKEETVTYACSLDTAAGEIRFQNEACFVKEKSGYRLVWDDHLIFPNLQAEDKVRISTRQARRGEILDRNGRVLAGEGTAVSVGIVPMKMEDRKSAVERLSDLLEIEGETIENKLAAKWVKEDSFVPIKTIPKVEEADLMVMDAGEEALAEQARQQELLSIPGVMLSDVEVREYPLKEAAAHLVGYVQSVTAEDLEEHAGEGYSENSVIGRSGMEGLYEQVLKGQNGCEIYIADANGDKKEVLAEVPVQDGQEVRLTIDAELQKALYEQFKDDKSCSVAMNPRSGEVLALISTPSYDDNDFILGMSGSMWEALNEDEQKPLYNRFRQVWCPGSTLKPIIAAIGIKAGAIDPEEDFGYAGLRWQKDASWGGYYVTTLVGTDPANLKNAMVHSDNIYFARAALRIGAEDLIGSLKELGFGEEVPFEIKLARSQYSNTEGIESEVQLADSGYGQGQILVNPVHLAALYTAFANRGNVLLPRLLYQEQAEAVIWIPGAFSDEVIREVLPGMIGAVNDPQGTGYRAHREDVLLAGKTGTAEIKAAQDDTTGTELGWLAIFTADPDEESPLLLVTMVEDVKEIGGSGYVVGKDKKILDGYLK